MTIFSGYAHFSQIQYTLYTLQQWATLIQKNVFWNDYSGSMKCYFYWFWRFSYCSFQPAERTTPNMLRYLGIYSHDIAGFMENFRCMRSKKLFIVFFFLLPPPLPHPHPHPHPHTHTSPFFVSEKFSKELWLMSEAYLGPRKISVVEFLSRKSFSVFAKNARPRSLRRS